MAKCASSGGPDWGLFVLSPSPQTTVALGRALGRALRGGEILALTGPLGAGKTTLARGIAEGLDVQGRVRSPSFTLVTRLSGRLPLLHMDLYRLSPPVDLDELGWADADDGRAVAIVEWAEKAVALLPDRLVRISLAYRDSARAVEIAGAHPTRHIWVALKEYDSGGS